MTVLLVLSAVVVTSIAVTVHSTLASPTDDAFMGTSIKVNADNGGVDVEVALANASDVDAGGLVPELVAALERARDAASADGIELPVASGYRSPREQALLLDEELAERGDLDEALYWVFAPEHSMHVRGLAIDINSGPGADWLETNGAQFGLCKTLAWEWWHFEWRDHWEQQGVCPALAETPEDAAGP